MEMELIYKETMKPSSGTPPHLKTYPLSFLDVTTPAQYMPMIYFYHPKQIENQESKLALLKKSLPEALSMYYPIAGRFKGRLAIDCNDQGVPLLVTKLKCHLSHFLNNPIQPNLLPLFPDNLAWTNMNNPDHDPIMAIQINCFHCGGIAIAVCVTHKLGDISTLINFVNDWAAITNHYQHQNHPLPSPPLLDAGVSVFPQGDLPVYQEKPYFGLPKSVCKRFVFEASKIEALKATAAPILPTRFEAVAALICKCAASALGLSPNSPLLSTVTVNLRKRIDPPVPSKTLGNMITFFLFCASKTDQLPELVSKMKQGMVGSEMQLKKYGGKYRDLDFIGEILKRDSEAPRDLKFELMTLSSWCRFSTYEADFGWGKPVWIASISNFKNGVVFMDARDGKGMEVLVNMEEQHMARFECNQDLLQYASVEPSVQLYHQDDLSTFNV
ncbi:acyltransferase Pun1-like [Arachis stenosperma]|uniref:acyltransferase Pun1-like n=1 Tax=Arachis stenosperma TaxID=217475 RepID=UPI0025ABDCE0|nr:acyltransferase Pun1-like [Arachis stenosperma]